MLGNTKEYTVIDHYGLKVGFMGIAALEWIETLDCLAAEDLDFEEPHVCAERLGRLLKNDLKCDFIISLNHMRFNDDRQ